MLSIRHSEIGSQHPIPSPIYIGLYHVGIRDKREGSQTVRELAQMSAIDSRSCYIEIFCCLILYSSILAGNKTSNGIQA